jgi:hypothetical protein
MERRLTRGAVFAVALALLAACGAEPIDLGTAMPTYEADVAPIYEDYCTACHAEHGVKKGGVELDRYRTAKATAVKSACTSVTDDLVEQYAEHLKPYAGNPPVEKAACEGWEIDSMPPGAKSRLTRRQQLLLLRWVELGAPE